MRPTDTSTTEYPRTGNVFLDSETLFLGGRDKFRQENLAVSIQRHPPVRYEQLAVRDGDSDVQSKAIRAQQFSRYQCCRWILWIRDETAGKPEARFARNGKPGRETGRLEMNPKLSVAIITLNEEANIRRTLESVKGADEIVVVDSGSSDRTVEICRENTEKVFHQEWLGFSGQKNFAIDRTTGGWVLSLDADEPIEPELAGEIKNIIASSGACDGYRIPRKTIFLGKQIRFGGGIPIIIFGFSKRERGDSKSAGSMRRSRESRRSVLPGTRLFITRIRTLHHIWPRSIPIPRLPQNS